MEDPCVELVELESSQIVSLLHYTMSRSGKQVSNETELPNTNSAVSHTIFRQGAVQKSNVTHEPGSPTKPNPFAFSPGQLNRLLDPKSLQIFKAFGGPQSLAVGLRTDLDAGLSVDETVLSSSVSFE